MSVFDAVKALWAAKEPATEVAGDIQQLKRGYKTPAFWVVLLAHLGSLVAAVQGYIPPHTLLLVNTVLAVLYNIARGTAKQEEAGVRDVWKTTEFWMSLGSQISAAFLALQQGGISPQWLVSAQTILAGAMVIARDLSHQKTNGQSTPAGQ